MHEAVVGWMTATLDRFDLWGARTVLDLGGRNVNGTTAYLFPRATYVVVDLVEHPSVHVVADAATVDLGEQFDLVVSTELLEHTDRGGEIIANAHRHLRPGGTFIATMAGPGRAPHGAGGEPDPLPGEWYRNIEPDQLDRWLMDAGFVVWQVDVVGTDVRCWAIRGDV
jgi:SAM-dependent methyltransferase